MQSAENYVNERLDYLGVITGVCEEIGLVAYLDQLSVKPNTTSAGNGHVRPDFEWLSTTVTLS
ncbi:MAG TPA: hypothetical protein DEV72_10355 [Ktedonobacter sp.]|jgi:hypothetical protein|nr:hypothetical protein [Ktedonobacter sp.]